MKTKLIYKIVSSDDSDELEQKVNTLISEGWYLQGGVSVAIGRPGCIVQAMTQEIQSDD